MKWLKLILIVLAVIAALLLTAYLSYRPTSQPAWGISYSLTYAQYLGFDPVANYEDILKTLHPSHVRLMAYWETVEPQRGQFDFSQIDKLLELSEQYHSDVIVVVGHKQPRWPECHNPDWYNNLSATEQRQAVLSLVTAEVNHFKSFPAVSRWQVENEAFFDFGPGCHPITPAALAEEVALVRNLDTKPIVLTDSGEKGNWFTTAQLGDELGTTMYRKVYKTEAKKYVNYHLPAAFYRIRAGIFQWFMPHKKILGIELQGEPWYSAGIYGTPIADQLAFMDAQKLLDNAAYARATGLPEHYFFGVEWWFWMKDKQHDPSLVNAAKQIFNP